MEITLKAARANRNLTQQKAAELIGVTRDTLGNWERGISYPDVIKLSKIESVYKMKYDDLIFLPK